MRHAIKSKAMTNQELQNATNAIYGTTIERRIRIQPTQRGERKMQNFYVLYSEM